MHVYIWKNTHLTCHIRNICITPYKICSFLDDPRSQCDDLRNIIHYHELISELHTTLDLSSYLKSKTQILVVMTLLSGLRERQIGNLYHSPIRLSLSHASSIISSSLSGFPWLPVTAWRCRRSEHWQFASPRFGTMKHYSQIHLLCSTLGPRAALSAPSRKPRVKPCYVEQLYVQCLF